MSSSRLSFEEVSMSPLASEVIQKFSHTRQSLLSIAALKPPSTFGSSNFKTFQKSISDYASKLSAVKETMEKCAAAHIRFTSSWSIGHSGFSSLLRLVEKALSKLHSKAGVILNQVRSKLPSLFSLNAAIESVAKYFRLLHVLQSLTILAMKEYDNSASSGDVLSLFGKSTIEEIEKDVQGLKIEEFFGDKFGFQVCRRVSSEMAVSWTR